MAFVAFEAGDTKAVGRMGIMGSMFPITRILRMIPILIHSSHENDRGMMRV